MSLSRYFGNVWNEPWEGMDVPSRLYDQCFGTVVPDDYFRGFNRRWPIIPQQALNTGGSGKSEVVNNENEFRISIDVQHFKPEEIKITSRDNRVIINARHEERPDEHGYIMREFSRQYVLPKDVDPKSVTSTLGQNGVLTLKATKMALEAPKELVIPITLEKGDS